MLAAVTFLIHRRGALLALSIVLTVLLGLAIPRAGFDTSLGVLLTKSDPYLQQRDQMAESFPAPVEISCMASRNPGRDVRDDLNALRPGSVMILTSSHPRVTQ